MVLKSHYFSFGGTVFQGPFWVLLVCAKEDSG